MKRAGSEENGEIKRSAIKQETVTFGYDNSYNSYSSSLSPSNVNQPLPGQPPLPPMPPPPGALPPPPHVFAPVHTQVTPMQTWTHPPPPWPWMTPQATSLPPQPPREIAPNNVQRVIPMRNNFVRRDRFNHNRNNIYNQRNNFHRKNRRHPRFDQSQMQFDQTAYFGSSVPNTIGLDWQRNTFSTPPTGHPADGLMNHMSVALSNHPISAMASAAIAASGTRHSEEGGEQEVKIVSEEVVVKKNKQRKPMSQSYPSRPWNREDAERALQIENEYNKTIKAQSLIIKFPDPDLNKDIVREFHSGIQNIHFQSPSGPRYCFIQMSENVNIDNAIQELEKIKFGVGHLKVERKSLRDEDNPTPEEIDPYTLYIGNLPESVNVNEVKSKFPSAARVDVGYAQKMRNTRYAFIRYNSVDESISAYKQAHDLMWDTRSIIVRFRRQRGNTCLPGEPKPNLKKVKEELDSVSQLKKEQQTNSTAQKQKQHDNNTQIHDRLKINNNNLQNKIPSVDQQQNKCSSTPTLQPAEALPTSVVPVKLMQQPQQPQLPWTPQPPQIPLASEALPPIPAETRMEDETILLTEIKEEPEDYEEVDAPEASQMDDEVDDDDDDEEEEDDDDDDDDDDENEEEDDDDDDEEEEEEDEIEDNETLANDDKQDDSNKSAEPTDHLDQMFTDLENMAGDIVL